MNVEKKQAVPTVEDIIALMEPDVIYSQQEFVERTGRTAGTIQTILDLAVARRQMERIVVRKRNHYRLPASPIENGLPDMRTHSELAGWEKQWRQFRAMCEAARPNTTTRPAPPATDSSVAKATTGRKCAGDFPVRTGDA